MTEDAQKETTLIVEMIGKEVEKHFPQSWKYLTGEETEKSGEHADKQSNENEPTDGTVQTTTT